MRALCVWWSLHCYRKWKPIDARKFGYDITVHPYVHMDWQGGTKLTELGWGQGIQDKQLVFFLAKH